MDFVDKHIRISEKFENILGFDLPDNIYYLPANFRYEYIFNDERPQKCILIEIFDSYDNRRKIFMRGVFSIKLDHWFQHLRYEVTNDKTITFILRTKDHDNRECDPYAILNMLELYDFNKRFKEVMEKCSEFINEHEEEIIKNPRIKNLN